MTGTLTPPIPVIGQPNSVEDPVVKESLEYLRDKINAILASDNTVDPALFNAANKIKYKWYEPKLITTEQSRENTSFGFLTTEDKIENIVVNENALVFINYSAIWKSSGEQNGVAAIFVGSNQTKNENSVVVESSTEFGFANKFHTLFTSMSIGLNRGGVEVTSFNTSVGLIMQGGAFLQRLAAGTYTIGIKYKATSGTVTAKERLLQIATLG